MKISEKLVSHLCLSELLLPRGSFGKFPSLETVTEKVAEPPICSVGSNWICQFHFRSTVCTNRPGSGG